jgi:hypothetical protein
MKLILIGIASVFLFLGVTTVALYFSYNNDYIRLKNQYEAQVAVDKAIYDEVWKVIKQQAGVSEKYAGDFKEIYKGLGRSKPNG